MAKFFCDFDPTRLYAVSPHFKCDREALADLVEASIRDEAAGWRWRFGCVAFRLGAKSGAWDMRERAAQAAEDAPGVAVSQDAIAELIRSLPLEE